MSKKVADISSAELKNLVVLGMQEKKAEDVIVLDLREIENAVTDFFVLCSANSDTQVGAIADAIEEEVHKKAHQNPWHSEGKKEREWVLIDYVNVVAHIFRSSKREFYGLENIWGDAKIERISEKSMSE